MKLVVIPVPNASDRAATPDESRFALSLIYRELNAPGFVFAGEIPADFGGYVRISKEDIDAVDASDASPAWAEYLWPWPHT
jgi:hypothetical protein